MNRVRRLGLALIVIGGLFTVAASNGFVTSSADRGLLLNTTEDENAYLGLEYPAADENRVIRLDSDDGSFNCRWFECYYEYEDLEVLTVTDQSPSIQLTTPQTTDTRTGDGITQEITYDTAPQTLQTGTATFECDASVSFNPFDVQQEQATEQITFSMEVSSVGDSMWISVDRTIEVECVPG